MADKNMGKEESKGTEKPKKQERKEPSFIDEAQKVLEMINKYHWGWFGNVNIPYSVIFGVLGTCAAVAIFRQTSTNSSAFMELSNRVFFLEKQMEMLQKI